MDLIIKGMDMPKNCAECSILQTGSLEHYCPLAKESMWSIDAESGRHNNCPLSEIPTPHGDLIDADVIMDLLEKSVPKKNRGHQFYVFRHMLRNAPTVIEKEG